MTAALSNPLDTLILRPGVQADHNFVRKWWLTSYADSAWARAMTPWDVWQKGTTSKAYWTGHHALVDSLLERATLTIATWPEDTWTIVGFAVTEHDVVHYVYVAHDYKRQGVARRLLEGFDGCLRVRYSHRSRACSALPIPKHWTYDPYAAFGLEGT